MLEIPDPAEDIGELGSNVHATTNKHRSYLDTRPPSSEAACQHCFVASRNAQQHHNYEGHLSIVLICARTGLHAAAAIGPGMHI